jgi:hypothetical protein
MNVLAQFLTVFQQTQVGQGVNEKGYFWGKDFHMGSPTLSRPLRPANITYLFATSSTNFRVVYGLHKRGLSIVDGSISLKSRLSGWAGWQSGEACDKGLGPLARTKPQ